LFGDEATRGKSSAERIGDILRGEPGQEKSKLKDGLQRDVQREREDREKINAYGRALDRDEARRARYVARYVPESFREPAAKLVGVQLIVAASILAYRPHAMDAVEGEHAAVQREALQLVMPTSMRDNVILDAYHGSLDGRQFELRLSRRDLRLKDGLLRENALPSEEEIRLELLHATAYARRPSTLVVSVSELRDAKRGDVTQSFEVEVEGVVRQIKAPRYELFGFENRALRRRFAEAVGELDPDQALLVASPDLHVSTHELFPDNLSARTFDHTGQFMQTHKENLAQLLQWRPDPRRTRFFNLIPTDRAVLSTLGLQGGAEAWEKARTQFAEFAEGKGFVGAKESSSERLLESLRDDEIDTLVIVAHGETSAIHFPDGTKVTVDDILNLAPSREGRRPVIVLVSCNTGNAAQRGVTNIAQALLKRGRAAAVLAPTSRIPASRVTIDFLKTLFDQERSGPARLQGPGWGWQFYVEEPVVSRRG